MKVGLAGMYECYILFTLNSFPFTLQHILVFSAMRSGYCLS